MELDWMIKVQSSYDGIQNVIDALEGIPVSTKTSRLFTSHDSLHAMIKSINKDTSTLPDNNPSKGETTSQCPPTLQHAPSIPKEYPTKSDINKDPILPFGCKFLRNINTNQKGSIHCLLNVNNHVWGGWADGRITIWNARTGKLIGSRQAHKGRIFVLILTDGHVWSSAEDNRIKVWSTTAVFEREIILNYSISSLIIINSHLWCGNKDLNNKEHSIVIYNKTTMNIENIFPIGPVRYLFLDSETKIVWACTNESITRIDCKKNHIIDTHIGPKINSMILVEATSTIWACSSDSTIYIYNRKTGDMIDHLTGYHESVIYSLMIHGYYVWSGGWDGSIKVWDIRTFEYLGNLRKSEIVNAVIFVPIKVWVKKNMFVESLEEQQKRNYDLLIKEYIQKYSPNNGSENNIIPNSENTIAQNKNFRNIHNLIIQDEEDTVCGEIMSVWSGNGDGTISIFI